MTALTNLSNLVLSEVCPAGEAWMCEVKKGQYFRIVDLEGNQAVDTLFISASNPEERYSATDTLAINQQIYLEKGTALYTNFDEERRRWHEAGLAEYVSESLDAVDDGEGVEVPEGGCAVESHMPGSIWKIECQSGDIVEEGATLAVIEAMKIEIPIIAPERMRVDAITIEKDKR